MNDLDRGTSGGQGTEDVRADPAPMAVYGDPIERHNGLTIFPFIDAMNAESYSQYLSVLAVPLRFIQVYRNKWYQLSIFYTLLPWPFSSYSANC